MTIGAIAFVDLDDTLFQTIGKCPGDVPADRLTPLGFTREGDPLSYATPRQMGFLNWLSQTTRLIPVTARSLDALRRVRIPFTAAICAHGGVILDDQGRVDREWAARMAASADAHVAELTGYAGAIAAEAERQGEAIRVRVLTEDDVPLYVLVKHATADSAALNRVVDAAVPSLAAGWTDHRNGNNTALMPPYLGKRHAVERLLPRIRAEHGDLPVLGIGDSLTDAPFMTVCDFAMMPVGSQLGGQILRGG
ncbi:hypothetical protein [Sphingomonas sp. CLY1604]|uniref:hypothetical protein n=1 Tax=Sphingomonas sp. CLY1604 TaxID=3457786 RepID=UPI003FD7FA72